MKKGRSIYGEGWLWQVLGGEMKRVRYVVCEGRWRYERRLTHNGSESCVKIEERGCPLEVSKHQPEE